MPSILDRSFKYVPASATNVRETFRRHGWIGPEEKRSGRRMTVHVEHIEATPPPMPHPMQNIGWSPGFGFPLFY